MGTSHQHPVHLQTPQITPKWSKQLQPSEVTPRSPEPSLSSRPPNPPQLPSLGISPETILMPSVACTSINSVTTPTAAHPLAPTSTLTARRTVLLPTRPVMLVTWATSRPMDKATARAKTRSPRRLATPVLALLAVSLALLHRCITIN